MGTLVSTIYIHYALRKAPCLKQILLGNLIALSIRESYYGNTAQLAFGASRKICALNSSLFLEIHKVFLQKVPLSELIEKAQALDEDRKPIPGLFVTGDCTGGFFVNNYPCVLPGIAMGRTMTFAIKAVKVAMGEE